MFTFKISCVSTIVNNERTSSKLAQYFLICLGQGNFITFSGFMLLTWFWIKTAASSRADVPEISGKPEGTIETPLTNTQRIYVKLTSLYPLQIFFFIRIFPI